MAYGLNPRLFVENGPAVTAAQLHSPRSSLAYRAWRGLPPERRIALVEKALEPPTTSSTAIRWRSDGLRLKRRKG